MIDKILKSTRGKPCSCPSGKLCTASKSKKKLPPQVIVEEPHRLPAPISITYYKSSKPPYQHNPHVQYVEKPKRWRTRKTTKNDSTPARCMTICSWYKRRKALRQLKKEYEKEKERERQRKREEFKKEMLELIHDQQIKKRTQYIPPKKTTTVQIKERSAYVKPKYQSKYATVKKFEYRETLTKRFVNFCYRFCCQLYCCLTCILIVALSVILLV